METPFTAFAEEEDNSCQDSHFELKFFCSASTALSFPTFSEPELKHMVLHSQ